MTTPRGGKNRIKEPLLELLLRQIDHGYAAAALRPPNRSRRRRRILRIVALLTAVIIGVLLSVAWRHTTASEPETARTRQALITKIEDRRDEVETLDDRASRLNRRIDEKGRAARRVDKDAKRAEHDRDNRAAATGSSAVRGPGIVVTVGDGPGRTDANTGELTEESQAAKVADRDLHELVNALWSVGAEAVAIDGQRLTGVSAIRAAGEAILVDFRPVENPYEITAIGDPRTLHKDFINTDVAARFDGYVDSYGMEFQVDSEARMELPSAAPKQPVHAQAGTP